MDYTTTPLDTIAEDAVREAAAELGAEDGVTTTYSGRAMYGAQCFGVTLAREDVQRFLVEVTAALVREYLAADDDVEDALDIAKRLAKAARTDSMGWDTILYFPDWNLHRS